MSRSYRKEIIKGSKKSKTNKDYWKKFRAKIKTKIKSCKNLEKLEELDFPSIKSIVNIHNICDYKFDSEYEQKNKKNKNKKK